MTPYELRFEIFKQAYNIVSDKFAAEMEQALRYNEDLSVVHQKIDYPNYPSYREVEQIAEKINTFVSEAKV
jgi:hypothetical protein